MLSRVAERIYWSARYIERVENTARQIRIYDSLLFDLPRRVQLSWYNLIELNGLETSFAERYSVQDERNVVKFMLGDRANAASVISSLEMARENFRTSRDIVPEDSWELINELHLYVQEDLKLGINRGKRHEFLEQIIKGCQQIRGLWSCNMPRDVAWQFMRLGSQLERADMTTRNLDAGTAAILETREDDYAVNARQIILGNVLRSLNAEQAYRRLTRCSVRTKDVIAFLIENPVHPRSLIYSLNSITECCITLPNAEPIIVDLQKLKLRVANGTNYDQLDLSFRDYLNGVQISINRLHRQISEHWFPQA